MARIEPDAGFGRLWVRLKHLVFPASSNFSGVTNRRLGRHGQRECGVVSDDRHCEERGPG
jgi:hypothetical protein